MKPTTLGGLFLIAVLLLGGCRRSLTAVPAEVSDAEYEVLSSYVTGKFIGQSERSKIKLVIVSDTLASLGEDHQTITWLNKSVPTLKTTHLQVFRAFQESDHRPSTFRRSFHLPSDYELIGLSEVNTRFSGPMAGWQRFYEEYPKSPGFLRLSRVGFSPDGNQAAFWTMNSCGSLCGSGYFVIMEKDRNSQWKIVQEVEVWAS